MGDEGSWKPRVEVRLLSDHITQTHAALKAQGAHTPTVLGALSLLRSQRESAAASTTPIKNGSAASSDESDDESLSNKSVRAPSQPSHRSTQQRTFSGPAADVSTTPVFSFSSPPTLPSSFPRCLRQSPQTNAILMQTPSSMLASSPALKTFPCFEDILLPAGRKPSSIASSSDMSSDCDPVMLSVSTSLSLLSSPSSSSSSSAASSSTPSRCENTSLTIPNPDSPCPSSASAPVALKIERSVPRKRPRRHSANSSDLSDIEDESHEFQNWGAHSAMLPQLTPPIKPMLSTQKTSLDDTRPLAASSCHQCKTRFSARKRDSLVHCRQPKTSACKKNYCATCLFKYYEEQPPQTTFWLCPSCRQICCCLLCWRAKCKADVALSPASALASALVFFPELLHSAMSGKDSSEDDSDSQDSDRSSSSPSPSPAPVPVPGLFPAPDIPRIQPYPPELYPGFRPDQAFPFFPGAPDPLPMMFPPNSQVAGLELCTDQKALEMEHNEEFQQQYQKAYLQHYERQCQQMFQQQFQEQQTLILQQAKLVESHMEQFQKEGSSAPSVS